MKFRLCLPVLLLLRSLTLSAQPEFNFPATPSKSSTRTYFGTIVTDNYAWLQKTEDNEVQHWVAAQGAFTDSFLNTLPTLSKIEKNISNKSVPQLDIPPSPKKYSFQLFSRSQEAISRKMYDRSVPVLYYRDKDERQWKELIDPLQYAATEDEHVTITGYQLSGDGNKLAFGISRNGTDWQEIRIMDMRSREVLKDTITWVKSSAIVWYKDGFFYKRITNPVKNQTDWSAVKGEGVYYHRLNTPVSEDLKTSIKGAHKMQLLDNRNLVIYGEESGTRTLFYTVSILDLEKDDWKEKAPAPFIRYPYESRYSLDVLTVRNDSAVIRNNVFAGNGFLGSFDIHQINSYKALIPEYDEVLTDAFYRQGKFHCLYRNDSAYLMYRFSPEGRLEVGHDFGRFMAVHNFKPETDRIAHYMETSFDRPVIQYSFNFETYESEIIGNTYVGYDVNPYLSRQVTYNSSDGSKVPMTLFYKKGIKINEQTPVLLTAYGGFGIITDPSYSYAHILWAESGGIYAVAHIRGGGERGSAWHIAGRGKRKQQGIDDFVWAAKYLVSNNYTAPAKLAITGASHGGMLVAAALNQHPELFGAAIPEVGLYDMLNYQDFTVGTGFSDEFGTSADSVAFVNLYKYSPYHNIRSGTHYPAVLVMTGDHDDRVPPFNSYKYVAAMQAASDGEKPVFLYVNTNAGHGGGQTRKDETREETVKLAFLFYALNVKPVLLY